MTIHVGNAPCSWGTLEFGSTQEDRTGYTSMLSELAESGYTGSELGDWGFMPTRANALAAAFRSRGLSLTGAFVGVKLRDASAHAHGAETAVRTACLLAGTADLLGGSVRPFLVLADDNGTDPVRTHNAGRISAGMGLTDDEWAVFARGAEQIARSVRDETGLRTVFHFHCAGYIETPEEIDRLMALTDPALLGLVFDTGHYAFGAVGCDGIVGALKRLAERIEYIHFKDFDPAVGERVRTEEMDYFQAVGAGVFCELGQGCVDFPAVLAWLRERGYNGFITVEQDVLPGMGAPKESAARNRAYLRSIGLE
ncbi:MAG: TIM barrel protein [Chloroflexi bacterium]|nr:TIM barrel protein [Chloroflexota bacterium]